MTMPEEVQEAIKNVQILENGRPIDPKSIDNYDSFMQFIMTASLVGQVYKIRKQFEDRESQGRIVGYDLLVRQTRIELKMLTPCQAFSLINTGPNPVKVWANTTQLDPRIVRVNVPLNVNFEGHKLKAIILQCDPGNTAQVEIVVKF